MAFLQEYLVSQSELRLLALGLPNRRNGNPKDRQKGGRENVQGSLATTTDLVEIRKERLVGCTLLRELLTKLILELGLRVKRNTKLVAFCLQSRNRGLLAVHNRIVLGRHDLDLSLNLLNIHHMLLGNLGAVRNRLILLLFQLLLLSVGDTWHTIHWHTSFNCPKCHYPPTDDWACHPIHPARLERVRPAPHPPVCEQILPPGHPQA